MRLREESKSVNTVDPVHMYVCAGVTRRRTVYELELTITNYNLSHFLSDEWEVGHLLA